MVTFVRRMRQLDALEARRQLSLSQGVALGAARAFGGKESQSRIDQELRRLIATAFPRAES